MYQDIFSDYLDNQNELEVAKNALEEQNEVVSRLQKEFREKVRITQIAELIEQTKDRDNLENQLNDLVNQQRALLSHIDRFCKLYPQVKRITFEPDEPFEPNISREEKLLKDIFAEPIEWVEIVLDNGKPTLEQVRKVK